MTGLVLKEAEVWLAGFRLTGAMNAVAIDYSAELQDDTTFADGGTRSRLAGLRNVTAQCDGFFDGEGIDEALFSRVGLVGVPMSVAPKGATEGERAFTFLADLAEYSPGGAVGEMLGFSAGAEGDGDLIRGLLAHNATRNASGDGTALQLGSVGAGQKLYAALHVLSAEPGDTLDVVIESDDASGFASPTTRLTFAQAAGVTSEWVEVTGPITDEWFRASWSVAGTAPSVAFVVIFGIK